MTIWVYVLCISIMNKFDFFNQYLVKLVQSSKKIYLKKIVSFIEIIEWYEI